MTDTTTIAISGATGQLGRLVVQLLRERHPAITTVALVRDPAKASDLAALGAEIRPFDYDRPETLTPALAGVDKLLLISGNAVGERERQHRAVIEGARDAGVSLVAYTSLLRAAETSLAIAAEHKATEAVLREVGIPHVLLRHGWYCENYIFRLVAAATSGELPTCAGDGQVSSATRADYAAAAVAVLTSTQPEAGNIYELAGSTSFTFSDMARWAGNASGRPITVVNLPKAEFEAALVAMGTPPFVAGMIAKSDHGTSEGGMFDESRTLERLIGRPTTPMTEVIEAALRA